MPRKPGPRKDARAGVWIAQLGTRSEATGRRGRVVLRGEDGRAIGLRDHAGAVAAFARLVAAAEAEGRRAGGPTAGDVVTAYLRWHLENGSRPDTVTTHEWHLTRFLDFEWRGVRYGDRPASSFEVEDWSRYRRAMQSPRQGGEKGAATGYVRLAFASVHACWRWAARPIEDREPTRLIPANPFEGMPRPKKGEGRTLILPWETVVAVSEFATEYAERPAAGSHNRKVAMGRERGRNRLKALACRLVVECGCRPIEAAHLRWEWVREGERLIAIPRQFIKTHKDRYLGLTPWMADRLRELRASPDAHPVWAFVRRDDPRVEPIDPARLAAWFAGMKAAFNERQARAEPPGEPLPREATLYTFRHSLVTLADEAGMDLRTIAPAFGHSADTAEKVYTHRRGTGIVEIMDRMRSAIGEKAGEGDKA